MISLIASSGILLAGVIDDLRSRKFHNWLFLTCLLVALVVVLATQGLLGLPMALLGFVAGLGVFLPLVLLKIIGAGDMKLMAAFGLAAGWDAVLSVAILSVIWGAVFGLLATIFRGHFKTLVHNMFSIVVARERRELDLQKIPFTIAILMGWLTHLVLRGVM